MSTPEFDKSRDEPQESRDAVCPSRAYSSKNLRSTVQKELLQHNPPSSGHLLRPGIC
jgi:hypothetical protein